MTSLRPESLKDLQDIVIDAAAHGRPMEIRGGGSKRGLGQPTAPDSRLELDGLSGIVSYDPAELVLTARAGTPLAEIEALLADKRQLLAFEPPTWRKLLGSDARTPTLGGTLACNMSGPRRIKAGAARDHFLGFTAVNGFGESFKAGGQVVKNVTGYDLSKLMAGSYGTLAALAEVSIKVMPRHDESRSLLILGLDNEAAVAALADGLNAPHEVSAAAHLPPAIAAHSALSAAFPGTPITALRLEGPPSSIAFRAQALRELFAARGQLVDLQEAESERFWREISEVNDLLPGNDRAIWRLSLPPSASPKAMATVLRDIDAIGYYDWGGGLLWLSVAAQADGGAAVIRAAVASSGGHATLVRAPDALRAAVSAFQPQPAVLAALTRRVKDSFDPKRIFNPGRLYQGM
ncbi:MAG TPA: glycolate oxidase subunit GlcE [Alphaproteobacteria bacterium]|jgi:glycolate oxidase FAD binding subunit